jgi:hypothetical protein
MSFVTMPSLKKVSIALDRITFWSKTFDLGSKIMAPLGLIAAAGFGTAAYFAPTDFLPKSMAVSCFLALMNMPFTVLVIFPVNAEMKKIEATIDTLKANTEGDKLLDKWTKLSTIRMSIMAVAMIIGLKEISQWYTL